MCFQECLPARPLSQEWDCACAVSWWGWRQGSSVPPKTKCQCGGNCKRWENFGILFLPCTCLTLAWKHVFCEARVRLNWKQSRLKSWMFQRWVSAAMATKTDPRFPDVLKSREYKSAIAWWRQGARCISLCCLLTFNLSILALRIYVDREALCKRLSWGNWT